MSEKTVEQKTEEIEWLALQAERAFNEVSLQFSEAVANNPEYAIEWLTEKVVFAQTQKVLWQRAMMIAKDADLMGGALFAEALRIKSARSQSTAKIQDVLDLARGKAAADFLRTWVRLSDLTDAQIAAEIRYGF